MFELEAPLDISDCLQEIYKLNAKVTSLTDAKLIEYIVNKSTIYTITSDTEEVVGNYFTSVDGKLSSSDRLFLESCYILMENELCVDTDGTIMMTYEREE